MTDNLKHSRSEEELSAELLKVAEEIGKRGYQIIQVLGNSEKPQYAHTLGLYRSYKHPEILFFAFDLKMAWAFLMRACEHVKKGGRFESGIEYRDVVNQFQYAMLLIDKSNYDDFFGIAQAFYNNKEFPSLQLFLPDHKGFYPWDAGVDPLFRLMQPRLEESRYIKDSEGL